jgi:hypothetical protein
MKLTLYLALKLVGYVAWSNVGVRGRNRFQLGVMWGAMRLLIGLAAGLAVRVATYSMTYRHLHSLPPYFAIFVPLSALEWLMINRLMHREPMTSRDVAWIAGGVVVSLIADLPIVHLRTIPIDRVIA